MPHSSTHRGQPSTGKVCPHCCPQTPPRGRVRSRLEAPGAEETDPDPATRFIPGGGGKNSHIPPPPRLSAAPAPAEPPLRGCGRLPGSAAEGIPPSVPPYPAPVHAGTAASAARGRLPVRPAPPRRGLGSGRRPRWRPVPGTARYGSGLGGLPGPEPPLPGPETSPPGPPGSGLSRLCCPVRPLESVLEEMPRTAPQFAIVSSPR